MKKRKLWVLLFATAIVMGLVVRIPRTTGVCVDPPVDGVCVGYIRHDTYSMNFSLSLVLAVGMATILTYFYRPRVCLPQNQ